MFNILLAVSLTVILLYRINSGNESLFMPQWLYVVLIAANLTYGIHTILKKRKHAKN
jgi:hypothetical protein